MNGFRKRLVLVFVLTAAVFAGLFGLAACNKDGGKKGEGELAWTEQMKDEYEVGQSVDLTDSLTLPPNSSYRLTAVYASGTELRTYGLTFRPTETGELKLAVTSAGKTIERTVLVTEPVPSLLEIAETSYEIHSTVGLGAIASAVSVLPVGTEVSVSRVRHLGVETDLAGREDYTFDDIGEYEFHYSASNSAGSVDGWMTVVVTREMTENEENDLTNTWRQMGLSTITVSDEHSDDSDWSIKVSASPSGTYSDGTNAGYWTSMVYFSFGEAIDLRSQYVEFDVLTSKNTYEYGVLLNYSTGYPTALYDIYQSCPGTSSDGWTTVSTASAELRAEPDLIPVSGIFATVLHPQLKTGYDVNDVWMLFDNLRVVDYPEIGPNEENDFTNNGAKETSPGTSFRRYTADRSGDNSDWSYRLRTSSERKAADYAYADVYFDGDHSFSEYAFSFFAKGNEHFNLSSFRFAILCHTEGGGIGLVGGYYAASLAEGQWTYVVSSDYEISPSATFCGVRFFLNTATVSLRDAELLLDNLILIDADLGALETGDGSNAIRIPAGSGVKVTQHASDHAENSAWSWLVEGKHFDFVRFDFGGSKPFSNYYLTMNVKAAENFAGKILLQFVAGDGSVKGDYLVEDLTGDGWLTLSTESDREKLLSTYASVNVYLFSADTASPVKVLFDNVAVVSRGDAEYVSVDADDWEIADGADNKVNVTLQSFSGGEKSVSLVGDYGNGKAFIDVRFTTPAVTPGKATFMENCGLVLAARLPEPTHYGDPNPYGAPGYFLQFNDTWFTLYGAQFNGSHLGSYAYPSGFAAETEYVLRFGVIYNHDSLYAELSFLTAEGELMQTYVFPSAGNVGYLLGTTGTGLFTVYSRAGAEFSAEIAKPYAFVPKPPVTAENGVLSMNAPWADGFTVDVDGASHEVSEQTYTVEGSGAHTVKVKAKLLGAESEEAEIFFISGAHIELGEHLALESSENLTDTSGKLTFSGGADVRVGAAFALTKGFTDEFLKIKFKAVEGALDAQKLAIGLRYDALTNDSLRTGYFSFVPYDFSKYTLNYGQNAPLYYETYIGSAVGIGEAIVSTLDPQYSFTAGEDAYMIAGVVGTGRDANLYVGAGNAAGLMRIVRWNMGACMDAHDGEETLADSGYFNVTSFLGTSRTLEYEVLDASEVLAAHTAPEGVRNSGNEIVWNPLDWAESYEICLDTVNAGETWLPAAGTTYTLSDGDGFYNIAVRGVKGSVKGKAASATIVVGEANIGVAGATGVSASSLGKTSGSITLTPESPDNAVGGGGSGAVIAFKENYTNEFLKVTFRALAASEGTTKLHHSGIRAGVRASESEFSTNVGSTPYWFSAPAINAGGTQALGLHYSGGHNNWEHNTTPVYRAEGFAANLWNHSATPGKEYSLVFGVVNGADDTYFYIGLYEEGELKYVARWNKSALAGAPEIADSGWWLLYDCAAGEQTFGYEFVDAVDFLADTEGILDVANNRRSVTWRALGWAESYEICLDASVEEIGREWTPVSGNSYTLPSDGIFNLAVRGVKGETKGAAAYYTAVSSDVDVEFANAVKASSTALGETKGNVTFAAESSADWRYGGEFALKKNYADEFLKVTFTSRGGLLCDQKINIAFRASKTDGYLPNNTWWWYSAFDNGGSSFIGLASGATFAWMNGVGATNLISGGWNVLNSELAEGEKYSLVTGVRAEGGETCFYFGIEDGSGTYLALWRWAKSQIADLASVELPESGWYGIYSSLLEPQTFEYEILSADEAFDAWAAANAENFTAVKEGARTKLTFSPSSSLGLGDKVQSLEERSDGSSAAQTRPSVAIGMPKNLTDTFIKVGFTATDVHLVDNHLYVSFRAPLLAANPVDAQIWKVMPFAFGADNQQMALSLGTENAYSAYGPTLEIGDTYYHVVGCVTAEGASTVYYAFLHEKGDGETETLHTTAWSAVGSPDMASIPASGFFGIHSCFPTERTITAEYLDKAEGLALFA